MNEYIRVSYVVYISVHFSMLFVRCIYFSIWTYLSVYIFFCKLHAFRTITREQRPEIQRGTVPPTVESDVWSTVPFKNYQLLSSAAPVRRITQTKQLSSKSNTSVIMAFAVTHDLRPWNSSRPKARGTVENRLLDHPVENETLGVRRFSRLRPLFDERFIGQRSAVLALAARRRAPHAKNNDEARFGRRRVFAIRMRVIAGVDSGPPKRKRQLRLLRKR